MKYSIKFGGRDDLMIMPVSYAECYRYFRYYKERYPNGIFYIVSVDRPYSLADHFNCRVWP